MRIDELQRELTGLADEITPLTPDVRSLHRQQRNRRVAAAVVAAVVVAGAVTAAVVAVTGSRRADQVRVTNTPTKLVASTALTTCFSRAISRDGRRTRS